MIFCNLTLSHAMRGPLLDYLGSRLPSVPVDRRELSQVMVFEGS